MTFGPRHASSIVVARTKVDVHLGRALVDHTGFEIAQTCSTPYLGTKRFAEDQDQIAALGLAPRPQSPNATYHARALSLTGS